jgi:hypothetical protein
MAPFVRVIVSITCLSLALPVVAVAATTAKDKAQFAKLAAGNGTFTCTDTPASKLPDTYVAKRDGNWYVSTETGDYANVTYTRWNHTMQKYVQVTIGEDGTAFAYSTKASDPFNSTWVPDYPLVVGLYPFTSTRTGNTIMQIGKYKDPATGKIITFKSVCVKS